MTHAPAKSESLKSLTAANVFPQTPKKDRIAIRRILLMMVGSVSVNEACLEIRVASSQQPSLSIPFKTISHDLRLGLWAFSEVFQVTHSRFLLSARADSASMI